MKTAIGKQPFYASLRWFLSFFKKRKSKGRKPFPTKFWCGKHLTLMTDQLDPLWKKRENLFPLSSSIFPQRINNIFLDHCSPGNCFCVFLFLLSLILVSKQLVLFAVHNLHVFYSVYYSWAWYTRYCLHHMMETWCTPAPDSRFSVFLWHFKSLIKFTLPLLKQPVFDKFWSFEAWTLPKGVDLFLLVFSGLIYHPESQWNTETDNPDN